LYAAEQAIFQQKWSRSKVTGAAACDNGGKTAAAVQPMDKQTLSHNKGSDHAKQSLKFVPGTRNCPYVNNE
jgi:hypothetical protein